MNLSYYFTVIALSLSAISAQAQTTVNTVPEGVTQFALVHNTTTYLSLPLEADPVYSGAISAVSANTISVADNPAPFVNTVNGPQLANLVAPGAPYFVKFRTGPQQGRIILVTANNTNTLTLDTTDHTAQTTPLVGNSPSTFDVQVGNTFDVFPGETLGTLFGTGTAQDPLSYVTGASNIGQADVVLISTIATLPASSYYFNTQQGFWTLYAPPVVANANNTIIYPHSSLGITRRNAYPDSVFPVKGKVTDVPLLIKTLSAKTCFTSNLYPVNITLGSLNLGSTWVRGTTIGQADVINVWNGSTNPGHFDSYFQLPSGGATSLQWRKYLDTIPNNDVSSFTIPAGSTISIARRLNFVGSASFLQPAMPYNLNN